MNKVRVLNNLEVFGALVMAKDEAGFPADPKVGTFVLKGSNLYGFVEIGGLQTWYPFGSGTNSYVHMQATPSYVWHVQHHLGVRDVWVQVIDQAGNIVLVNTQDRTTDSFRLDFTEPVSGNAVVVAPANINVPQVRASLIDIGGNVLIDSSGVRIRGQYVLTEANIAKQIDDAINARINQLIGYAPENLDTIEEIAASVQALEVSTQTADGGPY